VCANCTRIAGSEDLEARVAEAVEAREQMRDTDKRETRILIQTHPTCSSSHRSAAVAHQTGQVRQVIHVAYYRPRGVEAHVHHFHFVGLHERGGQLAAEGAGRAAGAHFAHFAHRKPQELLPTIRSRAVVHGWVLWPPLTWKCCWPSAARTEGAGSCAGRTAGPGRRGPRPQPRPRVYLASRQDALILLRTALREPDYSQLFHATESYRAGADGQEKTINLLRALVA